LSGRTAPRADLKPVGCGERMTSSNGQAHWRTNRRLPCVRPGVKTRGGEYDIAAEHYRVRVDGKWHDVPGDAVLEGPNKFGLAMVWFYQPTSSVKKSLINSGQGHRRLPPGTGLIAARPRSGERNPRRIRPTWSGSTNAEVRSWRSQRRLCGCPTRFCANRSLTAAERGSSRSSEICRGAVDGD
jgi:hypothetical protein